MKITTTKATIGNALAVAARIVDKTNRIPILSTVLIEAGEDGVRLTADNLDLRVACPLSAEVSRVGTIAVAGSLLNDIIKRCRDGEITLDAADWTLAIKAGSARFSLAVLPHDAFPPKSIQESAASFEVDEASFSNALKSCLGSVCSDQSATYLHGVHVAPFDGGLVCVSTNIHALTLVNVAGDVPSDLVGFTIPTGAATELTRLFGEGTARLSISPGALEAIFPSGLTLTTKLIQGAFPDHGRLIPGNLDKSVLVDRAEFSECLARVSVIAGDKERATRFSFSPEGSRISVKYTDQGAPREATDDLEAEVDHPVEIGLNASYVQAALSAIGSEMIEIRLRDHLSPPIFTPQGRSSPMCVISPLRV